MEARSVNEYNIGRRGSGKEGKAGDGGSGTEGRGQGRTGEGRDEEVGGGWGWKKHVCQRCGLCGVVVLSPRPLPLLLWAASKLGLIVPGGRQYHQDFDTLL